MSKGDTIKSARKSRYKENVRFTDEHLHLRNYFIAEMGKEEGEAYFTLLSTRYNVNKHQTIRAKEIYKKHGKGKKR